MSAQHSDTIELTQVARTVTRAWRVVVGFILLGTLLAAAIILFAPRRFTGKATIVLKSSSPATGASSLISQVTGLGDVTSGLLGGKSQLETEIEVLSSRAVIGEVVDSLVLQARFDGPVAMPSTDLLVDARLEGAFRKRRFTFNRDTDGSYRFAGKGESGKMTPGVPVQLSLARLTFKQGAALPPEFALELRDREDAIDRVLKALDVEKEKGELVSVAFRGEDSLTAARVPNALLDIYLLRRKGIDKGVNHRRVDFLTAKGDSMARELAEAASALRRQQEVSGVLDATAAARIGLENAGDLRSKLTDVQVEQGALQQLMSQISAKTLTPRQLAAYPTFLRSPAVNNIVAQLADVETRRTMLLRNKTEDDEEVVALAVSARNLEQQLVPYATTYASSLQRQRADLEATLQRMNAELARLPRAAESTSQLQMRVQDLARLSGGLQAQLVEAKLAAIGEGGDLHPLDSANAPKKPSFPVPVLTAGIGVFGGLLVGLIAALLVGSLGRWVGDPAEIERSTGVPAVRFDPATPLLLTNAGSRTLMVAPIEAGVQVNAVVRRLAETATARSISAVVLTLADDSVDANGSITRLESEYDLVIVELPGLTSNAAAATLHSARPVILVARAGRVERRKLMSSVGLLRRLDVPCAGIVLDSGSGAKLTAANERALSR